MKYPVLKDFEGIALPKTKSRGNPAYAVLKLARCDCGLIHRVCITNGKDAFGFAVARDKRATAQHRKNKKFK